MLRKLLAVAVALFVFAGGLVAAEVKGKLVKVDGDKITVVVGAKKGEKGEEKTFTTNKDTKFISLKAGKKGEKPTEEPLSDGLKNAVFSKTTGKGGPNVTVEADDKGVASCVKVATGGGKKKPENK